jgi:acyl-lipid Delta6-acetylenase / acyl-lipid (9-3)-desaturase
MPLFAITDNIFDAKNLSKAGFYNDGANGFWSSFHRKFISPDGISNFLVGHQHYFFYPIMAVARFNLYIQGWIFAFNAKHHDQWFAKRYQMLELLTLPVFVVWVSALVSTLPFYERFVWMILSHALAGILHVQICISHYPMDTYHGHAYNDITDEWFKMQCKTTMNVDCPRWLDFLHGGLQFQIEHHLFPRLPRHNLREARALVKPFCDVWKVPYHEKNFYESNLELIGRMKEVALKCKLYGLESVGGFEATQLYDGMNARG